ncbi:MAG: cytochrome P450 [Acidimicrobiia bacterium]|nr:cytochrome P450 [Acidimicrobiia bacterium]
MADGDAAAMSAAVHPVAFNPLDPAFVASPYETYAALRDDDPVHWSKLLCGWVVTRYDDVAAILADPSMSSDIRRATPNPIVRIELDGLAKHDRAGRTIVHLDDPDHARVRKLMAPPFRVREVDRLRGLVDARVAAALDRLAAATGATGSEVDLVAEFAYPLPVEIFSRWLGVPDEAAPRFRYWTSWVARSRDPMPAAEREEFFAALDAMYRYLEDQAELKRREPAGDLLSYLVHAEDGGDALGHEELMAQLITLYMAGHEPTASLVANGVLALLHEPGELAQLRADPGLVPNAVCEMLRFDGPNQFVRRVTTEPVTLSGTEVPAGDILYVGLASANRDPRRWGADAGRFDVDRTDADDHVQFAGGAHACLGAHLARLQAERFLTGLLARVDGLELAGDPTWSTRMFIRGLQSLPVRCTVRP